MMLILAGAWLQPSHSAMVRLSSMLTSISQHLHTGIEQPRVPNNYYGIGRNGNEI
jgi:hypothetical protein